MGIDFYEIDENNQAHLATVSEILGNLSIESNFATLPQLISFTTDEIARRLFLYETHEGRRLFIITAKEKLKVARILFENSNPDDLKDEILIGFLKQKFNINYIVYNLLSKEKMKMCSSVKARQEYVLDLKRLVNCADPRKSVSANTNLSIPKRVKELTFTRRKYPSLVYESIKYRNNKMYSKIVEFLTKWSLQKGLEPYNDKRLLKLFWLSPELHWGCVLDKRINKIVALNCFTEYASRSDLAVSIVNKNLRNYKAHLGVLSYIYQAKDIKESFPEATKLLIGGEGSEQGQTDFKEGCMSGGYYSETYSCEAYCDDKAQSYFAESCKLERERFFSEFWK